MNQQKKIAFFSFALDHGGAEKVISLLSGEMTKYYKVYIILFYNEVHFKVSNRVEIISLFKGNTYKQTLFGKVLQLLQAGFKYIRLVKKLNLDVSISFLTVPNIINSFCAFTNKNIKTIVSERNYASVRYKEKSYVYWLAKKCIPIFYNMNDLLFSNSIYINRDLKDNFNLKIQTAVIYNPIKMAAQPIKISLKKPFKIVNVARLTNPKNQRLLIKVMGALDQVSLSILGEGVCEQELKKLTKVLGLENQIKFYGNVNHVKNYLKENHCFVLSSNVEGFPNALLEAMSVGLPVISTNCLSGPLELLNDNEPVSIKANTFYKAKYGLLVNPNDELGMISAIKYYMENQDVLLKYAQLGHKRAKSYSLETIGNQFKNTIENLK